MMNSSKEIHPKISTRKENGTMKLMKRIEVFFATYYETFSH